MEDSSNIRETLQPALDLGEQLPEGATEIQLAALQQQQAPGRVVAAQMAGRSQTMVVGPDGVVVLPAGVDLDDIRVQGRNLIVKMPDGTNLIIIDGAVTVPQLVISDVAVPSANLAALLIGQEPQPAAGPPRSSGGNFAVPVGDIGDPFGLGNLLPPTALEFPEHERRELFQDINEEPDVIVITPQTPGGSVAAGALVNEAGLPARLNETPGSNAPAPSEITTGTIVIDPGNAPATVTINGVPITDVGQVITTPLGELTITSISDTEIGYSYVLGDNSAGDNVTDVFDIVVTDNDGDVAEASLVIDIIDDVPTARNDTDSIAAGTLGPATGNVITGADTTSGLPGADTPGADGAEISGIRVGASGAFTAVTGTATISGQYGVLTIHDDGSYSYLRNAGTPGGVTEIFNYQLTDGDGDNSVASLTITIPDAGVSTGTNAAVLLDDDALAGGNPNGVGDDVDAANTTGTLAASGGDGALTYGFQLTGAPAGFTYEASGSNLLVKQGSTLVLTVTLNTATGAYTVTQNAPIDHPAGADENNQPFSIAYSVTDADGDTATGTLSINVDDDTPVASNDRDTVSISATTATGNVITDASAGDVGDTDSGADSDGADGGGAVTGVSSNNVPANSDIVADGAGNFAVAGQYGTLTLNQDGSYTYQVTGNPTTAVVEVFTYTFTDGDGDTTTATLTIDIAARDTIPVVGANATVLLDDDTLTDGNADGTGDRTPDTANLSGTLSGSGGDGALTFSFNTTGAPAGFTYVPSGTSLLIQQGGQTVITVTLNTATGAYTVTQNLPIDHAQGGDENNQPFQISYTVEDSNGSAVNGTLSIDVDDDTPELSLQGTLSLSVEEDDINNAQSTGNNEDASVGADSDTGSLSAIVLPGADGPGTYSFDTSVNGTAVLDSGGNPVLSKNAAVLYSVSGNVITGYVNVGGGAGYDAGTDRAVFTFTLTDANTGAVAFQLLDQLDHPTANAENNLTLALGAAVEFTDADGDSIGLNGRVNVVVQDDVPTGPLVAPDCDDNITDNDPNSTIVTNNLGISIGTDEPMVVTGLSYTGPDLTAGGGFPVLYDTSVANTIRGYIDTNGGAPGGEQTVFTLTIDPTDGDYTFDLALPLDGTTGTIPVTGGTDNGAGPTGSFTATDAADQPLSLVVGWTVDGFDPSNWTATTFTQAEVNRSANGYGVEDANVDDGSPGDTNDGDLIRFDFDDADAGPGGYSPPAFDGPAVNSATFDLKNYQAADTVYYKVIFVNADGSFASEQIVEIADPSVSPLTINAPSGDFIDSVEFYAQDGNGFIDLMSVGTFTSNVDVCLDFAVGLTDFDGDPLNTTIHVTIEESGSGVRGSVALVVNEFALDTGSTGDDDTGDIQAGLVTGSNPNQTSETDSDTGLTFTAGSDAITGIVFADPDLAGNEPNIVGLDDGVVVDWSLTNGGRTMIGQVGGQTAIILELSGAQTAAAGANVTPTVKVTLTDSFQHQDNVNASQLVISDIEIVANSAGGPVTGLAQVTVTDDVPNAVDDGETTTEGGANETGNVLTNDEVGADVSGTVTAVSGGGTIGTEFNGTYGKLTLNADGSYVYKPNASVPDGSIDSFTYTLTDSDGDTDTAVLSFTFSGDSAPTAGTNNASVDEDGLASGNDDNANGDLVDGNADGDNDETTFSGTLAHNYGADVPGTIKLVAGSETVNGVLYTYTVNGAGTVLTANDGTTNVFTVTLTNANTGAYRVDLLARVEHLGSTPGLEDNLDFTLGYEVFDSDSVTGVAGTLTLNIDDDIPVATDDGVSTTEGGTNKTGNVLTNDDIGADDPGATVVTAVSGGTIGTEFNGTYGKLTLNADGSYTYKPNASVPDGSVDSFIYTVTDADGDTDTAVLSFTFSGDSAPTAGTNNASVDEDGLAAGNDDNANGDLVDGNADGDNDETTFSGTLAHNYGADVPGTIKLVAGSETVNGVLYTYTVNGAGTVLTANDGTTDVFKVTLTNPATGAYKVELLAAVDHLGTTPGFEDNLDFTLGYEVFDSDSVTGVAGTLTLTIDDDVPAAYSTAPVAATGVNGAGSDLDNPLNLPSVGADTPGTLSFNVTDGTPALSTTGNALTYNGQPLYYSRNTGDSSILEARTSATPGAGTLVFQIDLDQAANNYDYTQYHQLLTSTVLPITSLSSIGGGNITAKAINVASSPFDLILSTQVGNTVNTNSTQIGVGGGNSIEGGEHIRFDLVQNASMSGADLVFGEYYSANSFRQDVSGLSGPQNGDFIIRAIAVVEGPGGVPADPADGNNVFYGDANDTFVAVTQLNIYNDSGTLVAPASYAGLGIVVTAAVGGGWQILNLPNDYDFEIVSSTAFQAVQVEGVAGTGTFKLGAMSIGALVPQAVSFDVPIKFADSDGDGVTANIRVNLSAPPPVVLDLDGDGVEFTPLGAVAFDYDGDGNPEPTAWVGADDGLLVHDANGDGKANDGSEITFADPDRGAMTDLAGLRLDYDSNNDGKLSAADSEYAKFGVWQDANGNGVTDAGEFKSLAELGITSIDLTSDGQSYTAAGGDVVVHGQTVYTKVDGTTGIVADAQFATGPASGQSATSQIQKLNDQAANQNVTSALVAAGVAAVVAQPLAEKLAEDQSHETLKSSKEDGSKHDQHTDQAGAEAQLVSDVSFIDSDEAQSQDVRVERHGRAHDDGAERSADTDDAHQAPSQLLADTSVDQDNHGVKVPDLVEQSAMPVIPHEAAVLAAASGETASAILKAVLADALGGGDGKGPDIAELLDALPMGGAHEGQSLAMLHGGGGESGAAEHAMAALAVHFGPDLNVPTYEDATAAVQAA